MSAIARMKAMADIDICHELAPKYRQMIKKLSLPQSLSHNQSSTGTILVVFEEWLDGKSRLPPTWAEMMAVLREIGANDLAECIEKYFAGEQFHSLDHIHTLSVCMHAALMLLSQSLGVMLSVYELFKMLKSKRVKFDIKLYGYMCSLRSIS